MEKHIFTSIWNELVGLGKTKLSKSKKSIVCFTFVPDTGSIDSLLPAGWSCTSNQAQFNPQTQSMGPAMTIVFQEKVESSDEAFAEFDFS